MIQKNFSGIIRELIIPGKVTILAVTGQAGAGKTTRITPLVAAEAEKYGHPVAQLGLDSFFILSSRERREWMNEKGISREEKDRRADQINWWDFSKAQKSLFTLRQGRPLILDGVYNRADSGELTGQVRIIPPPQGMLVVFEGVAVCHLDGLDETMFVHAPAHVRLPRLRERDPHRQGREVLERFEVTQAFEIPYFAMHWHRISLFVDNSLDTPQMMGQIEHQVALADIRGDISQILAV